MCGIVAIASKEKLNLSLYNKRAMLDALSKRGPDGEGEHVYESCWLGHRRLSIIDLEGGKQPMIDDELAVTFNGEIYNYLNLRKKLEKRGHTFKTKSDTEVILKAYREYGTECPKHLDGMFAFAIWNNTDKTMFLARDRFGKKPLYYSFDEGNILLASEIKSLLASGKIEGILDRSAIDDYLHLMYIPQWKSVYKNIYLLPPACSALFKDGTITVEKYWTLTFSPIKATYEEARAKVKLLIHEAVKKRMLAADVEVGSFLSGGVDSTYVSLIAKEFINHPLKTFSLGYGEYINELPFAEQASRAIQSEHYTLQASGDHIADLEEVISYFDEPHADSSDFPQHLLSKLASSKVKVALSGDGADEIFMGYGWHTRFNHLSFRAHTFEKLFSTPFRSRITSQRVFSWWQRLALWGSLRNLSNDIYDKKAYQPGATQYQNIYTFDLTSYLPGQLLFKVDRTSMMHSLEVRSPFLDTALVEYVCNLPTEFKVGDGTQKKLLKDLLSEYMPQEFVNRKKQGFGAPTKSWLREEKMKQYVLEQLGPNAMIRKLFVSKTIDYMLNHFYAKGKDREVKRLWILLCLEIWLKKTKPKLS